MQALKIFILTFGIVALLILFPTLSGLAVFSKGEFAYLESMGIIFTYITLFSISLLLLAKKFPKPAIKNPLVKITFFAGILGINIFLLMLVILITWIRFDVKSHCQDAIRTYGGDCTNALISLLDDDNQSLRSRNNAIYALGQLADDRALPTLESYYTGILPEREPLHTTLSQYELKKAITWCKEGNALNWLYWDQNNWQ